MAHRVPRLKFWCGQKPRHYQLQASRSLAFSRRPLSCGRLAQSEISARATTTTSSAKRLTAHPGSSIHLPFYSVILNLSRRVFVTGLGTVNPLGNSVAAYWQGLVAGRSGIARIQQIEVGDLGTQIGGEVRDLDVSRAEVNDRALARRMDRASQFAVIAAREALEHSGNLLAALGDRAAVVLGAGLSGLMTLQQQTEILLQGGPRKVSPLTIPLLMPNAAAANVSLAFGLHGASYSVSSACASSGHAMIDACRLIQADEADLVITGGTEASLTRLGFSSFINMRAMAKQGEDCPTKACRPFEKNRTGLIMSEGAGVLVFESEERIAQRGGRALAEVVGYATTSDAFHLTQPREDAEFAGKAISGCLARAGVVAAEIADQVYVNAHGTATKHNDAMETVALRRAFGESVAKLRISSTKSMTGHLIGAASGVEMIACCLALRDNILPPTINLDEPDPECNLDFIPHSARKAQVEYALNNCFGFGGHNVSMLLKRV